MARYRGRNRQAIWNITMEMQGQLPNVRKSMRPLISALADLTRSEWIRFARQRLRTTARAYTKSILPVHLRGTTATITLTGETADGQLANMLEQGHAPFDMKPGFLSSSKAKRTVGRPKGRPYMHIPFKQGVPGGGDRGANVMPWPIYRLAKNMPVGKPLKLPSKFSMYGIRSRLSPDQSKWGAYTWKSSPYAGVAKSPVYPGLVGVATTPFRYSSFRTVSRRSDPNSWIHPGFQARNIMEQAQESLERLAPQVIDSILSGNL